MIEHSTIFRYKYMYLNEDNFREYKDKIVLNKSKDKIKQNTRSVNILLLLYMSLYGY